MSSFLLVPIFFLLIFVVLFVGKKKKDSFQYDKRFLLTKAEANFYKYLVSAVDFDKHLIFPKVRIADIVKPKKGLSKKENSSNFWRTSSKHIDFLLVDKKTYLPVVCIELNDSSHNRKDRTKRDILVDKVMASADVPMLWVKARRTYVIDKIRVDIEEKISERKK